MFRGLADGVDGDDLLTGLVNADRIVALNLNLVARRQERVEPDNETGVTLEESRHSSDHSRRVNPAMVVEAM